MKMLMKDLIKIPEIKAGENCSKYNILVNNPLF